MLLRDRCALLQHILAFAWPAILPETAEGFLNLVSLSLNFNTMIVKIPDADKFGRIKTNIFWMRGLPLMVLKPIYERSDEVRYFAGSEYISVCYLVEPNLESRTK